MINPQGKLQLHIFVSGRVQGVGFRGYVEYYASELGLTGWVRNLPDKRVEVLAEGNKEELEKLMEKIQKGSPGSRVDETDAKINPALNAFKTFKVKF